MKMVLVGSEEAKEPLRAIAEALRSKRVVASCYFDKELPHAEKELEGSSFLILGLSRASREANSPSHAKEKAILLSASRLTINPPHIAVVRDVDGWVSAPYLTMTGLRVAYLFTGCQPIPDEVFSNAIKTGIGDTLADAGRIAEILRCSLRA